MENDLTQELVRHSMSEHHEIDEVMKTLETTEPSSPAWLTHAKKLRETVLHHLDEEEHKVLPAKRQGAQRETKGRTRQDLPTRNAGAGPQRLKPATRGARRSIASDPQKASPRQAISHTTVPPHLRTRPRRANTTLSTARRQPSP
ncbi:hypothetical protein [Guyparkeria halopsychrophila]|uniref:hypothetical protein n=1 Tax=Guyparkeria halopsychrophila TaxID=3139421 RepID=UPI0037CC38E5